MFFFFLWQKVIYRIQILVQMIGASLYGRYSLLVAMDATKDSEDHKTAVKNIFEKSFTVCVRVWKSFVFYWKLEIVGEARKEEWRKLVEPFVSSLVLLLREEEAECLYL